MLSGWLITAAIFVCLTLIHAVPFLDKSRNYWASLSIFGLISIASIYLLLCGFVMAADWQDPFTDVDISDQRGRRGSWVIYVIRLWPYVLMATSAYFLWNSMGGVLNRWQKIKGNA